MPVIKVPYHKGYRELNIPENDRVQVLSPDYKTDYHNSKNEKEIIMKALRNPIDQFHLNKLLNTESKVAIMVDDNTRPTPTAIILPIILKEIGSAGVLRENITIIFACGTHRKLTVEEEKSILGKDIWTNFRIVQHGSKDKSNLKYVKNLGKKANKWAVDADLRIMIGFIKSHDIAGYSGGSKSILPGVADFNTILENHSYKKLSDPYCGIGILEGNPCRQEMDEMARALEPNFILNVVLDKENRIMEAVAGDVISAHRKGVEMYNEIALVEVDSRADIVMACCPHPTDTNLYQSLYGCAVTVKVERPILKHKGIIILVSHCSEGLGDESFTRLIMKYKRPDLLLEFLSINDFTIHGQWAAQAWADLLNYAQIIMVTEGGIPEIYFEKTPMLYASTLNEAWMIGKKLLNKTCIDGYILPNAPLTLPILSE